MAKKTKKTKKSDATLEMSFPFSNKEVLEIKIIGRVDTSEGYKRLSRLTRWQLSFDPKRPMSISLRGIREAFVTHFLNKLTSLQTRHIKGRKIEIASVSDFTIPLYACKTHINGSFQSNKIFDLPGGGVGIKINQRL